MAAARSVWKGFIQVSLVSVPVRAYAAAASSGSGGGVTLNQLHAECHSRVRYLKTCPVHGELKESDIVRGYEFAKDQYVVIDPAEVQLLRKESDKSIRIEGFVKPDAVDARYMTGRTQDLAPEGAPAFKPYALLHKAMVEADRFAFAKVVLAGREQLVLLRPVENLLVMSFVSYAAELKPIDEFRTEVPTVEVEPKEMELGRSLTKMMSVDDFDLGAYVDDYNTKLTQLVEAKVKGEEIVQAPADVPAAPVGNLMEALQKSIAAARGKAPAAAATASGKPAKPPKLAATSAGVAEVKQQRKRKTS